MFCSFLRVRLISQYSIFVPLLFIDPAKYFPMWLIDVNEVLLTLNSEEGLYLQCYAPFWLQLQNILLEFFACFFLQVLANPCLHSSQDVLLSVIKEDTGVYYRSLPTEFLEHDYYCSEYLKHSLTRDIQRLFECFPKFPVLY